MPHTKTKRITVGATVNFDSDNGPQSGIVEDIKADLGNGQRIAMVKVPGTLDGVPWQMPVDQLQHATVAA
jgi:hypothetical protein